MPVASTNRNWVACTLYRKPDIDGKERHVFARNPIGEPVDEMPAGFRVSESPNGVVSVARDRPALIRPDEIAAAERKPRRHPRANDYRLVVNQKRIAPYAKIGANASGTYGLLLAGEGASRELDAELREFDDPWDEFTPVLRIALRDPERRAFAAQQRVSRWEGDIWIDLGTAGSIDAVAREVVPQLPSVTYVFVLPFTEPAIKARRERDSAMDARGCSGVKPASIHQLKATLLGSMPPSRRRIAVPSDDTLGELHQALHMAMGWRDWRLHDFSFGDSWEHDIVVEKVGLPKPDASYPGRLAGKRACPPDHCGGVWGYADLLEKLWPILTTPSTTE